MFYFFVRVFSSRCYNPSRSAEATSHSGLDLLTQQIIDNCPIIDCKPRGEKIHTKRVRLCCIEREVCVCASIFLSHYNFFRIECVPVSCMFKCMNMFRVTVWMKTRHKKKGTHKVVANGKGKVEKDCGRFAQTEERTHVDGVKRCPWASVAQRAHESRDTGKDECCVCCESYRYFKLSF